MKQERKCECGKILGRDRIYVHLSGCPEDYYTEEYKQYPWWKKLFYKSPKKIYRELKRTPFTN